MSDFFSDLADVVQGSAAIALDNVTVEVKTNYGPAIRIPTERGGDTGGTLSRVFGLRGGVIIRNQRGVIIETIGDPAPTDPIRVTALASVVAVLGFLLVRGIRK